MGFLEVTGCAMIAFAAPLSLFVFFVASDPLRVIIFTASAFFWLLSLLASATLSFIVVPLRENMVFAALESVLFQELFRYLYYVQMKKAERGLEKVSAKGMHIEGVHSLKNAKPTTAFVCGLGYGVIAGAFSLANTLSHAVGSGTLGLPALFKMSSHFGDYTFFLMSAINTGAIVLLHVAYSVIFWYGCENKKYLYVVGVCVTHLSVTGMTLLNRYDASLFTTPAVYLVTVVAIWLSYILSGGSYGRLSLFLKRVFTCQIALPTNTEDANEEIDHQQQEEIIR